MIEFETAPDRYRHWQVSVDGEVATLSMDVREDAPLKPEYTLKLNSYDLGVDIELADAVQRMRFEHPEVKVVILRSAKPNVFCAGANIFMLGTSSHGFKVNFCKFTNETRLAIEDASLHSGQHYIAACNGTTAGGGYELALACDEIMLVDDGYSAVSLPETALLGVLPGTGGLTRLVDKRKVRRDRADVFCTLAEGIRGERALEWGLVDQLVPRSRFDASVEMKARQWAERENRKKGPGLTLAPLSPQIMKDRLRFRYVDLAMNRAQRTAVLTVFGPPENEPCSLSEMRAVGPDFWALRAFREIDQAVLHLRFNEPEVGLIILKTEGSLDRVKRVDEFLTANSEDWQINETLHLIKRTLKRLDLTSRTIIALIESGSCFAGSLLEMALAADRSYMLDSRTDVRVALTTLNNGYFPMSNGLSRLQSRFLDQPEHIRKVLAISEPLAADDAEKLGLVTFALDELDYEDDVRFAIEERASLNPDALTGMEASLRFAGPETMETKIFGRLSAWQNWIFTRSNATGARGSLTLYGKPERPVFDWNRV